MTRGAEDANVLGSDSKRNRLQLPPDVQKSEVRESPQPAVSGDSRRWMYRSISEPQMGIDAISTPLHLLERSWELRAAIFRFGIWARLRSARFSGDRSTPGVKRETRV